VSTTTISLADHQLERLADLIAARLADPPTSVAGATDLVTADELARILRVDQKSIYRHAEQLGAIRVGRRLRFDPAKALAAWQASSTDVGSCGNVAIAHKRGGSATGDLLPIGRRTR
jgi:hypothetical protein